jgi:hypothetical protein
VQVDLRRGASRVRLERGTVASVPSMQRWAWVVVAHALSTSITSLMLDIR